MTANRKNNGVFLLAGLLAFIAFAGILTLFKPDTVQRFTLAAIAAAPVSSAVAAAPEQPGIPPAAAVGSVDADAADAAPAAAAAVAVASAVPDASPASASAPDASAVPAIPSAASAQGSWDPLIDRLVQDGFDQAAMQTMFTALAERPLPEFMAQKVIEIAILRFSSKASLALPKEEAANFSPPNYAGLSGLSASAGRRFMEKNAKMFTRIYERQGVPAPYVVAILMVETGLGGNLGARPAMLALGSMASFDSLDDVLPSIQNLGTVNAERRAVLQRVMTERSEWAYKEVKALIEYCAKSGKDPVTLPGSVYGAIGLPQFMPSNIPLYGVDADGDKVVDVFKLGDAAWSVARYLNAHGWKNAETMSAKLAVLKTYNNSDVYASTVYGVAMQLISPTTHAGAEAARQGKSAISSARQDARAALPAGKAPESANVKTLNNYADLLK